MARIYDPLSPRTLRLGALDRVPDSLQRVSVNGREFFPELPYVIRLRLSYDPVNRWLTFEGYLDESGVGEPLLLPNVMNERERDRIKQLVQGDSNWANMIDRLYDLTRNPNGVDLEPANGVPDQALRIGLTTDASGRVVPEEFGDLPKALADCRTRRGAAGTAPAGQRVDVRWTG